MNPFVRGLDDGAKALMRDADSLTRSGMYATNFITNMANTGYGGAALGGAALGAAYGGATGYMDGQGFLGSAVSGGMSGAMLGAGAKFGSGWYAGNAAKAFNAMGGNGIEMVGGKYKFSMNNATENPFRFSLFTSSKLD